MPVSEIQPPEPRLTASEMLARAEALQPILRERQALCETAGRIPEETNAAFVDAGFYRILQPRRFGGYEFDIPTFYRVMIAVSRGCIESGWVLSLTAGHPLVLAAFPESTQRAAYGTTGEFRCPAAGSPIGSAVPNGGGYRVTGAWESVSGIDIATHYIGFAATPEGVLFQILLDKGQFEVVDNWQVMGMRGTGSKRVVASDVFVPSERALPSILHGRGSDPLLRGPSIYDNPMYAGRILPFLIGEAASVAVGGAYAALDEYAALMRRKTSIIPPFNLLRDEPDHQLHYGRALALISTAEAALIRAGEDFMAYATAASTGGEPFDAAKENRLLLIEQQAVRLCWEAMELIYRTAGTSASAKEGTPIGRAFRNLAVINTHPGLQIERQAIAAARVDFAPAAEAFAAA